MAQRLRGPRRSLPSVTVTDLPETSTRVRLYALLIALLISLLVARMWYLQILHGDEFRNKARSNQVSSVRSPAPRGVIQDSQGRPLVTNGAQFTIVVSQPDLPKKKWDRAIVYRRLAILLDQPEEDLLKVIQRSNGRPSDPIVVAKHRL
jgi:penicillin-binding protein 2